jgi:hypothetical protein
MKPTVPPVQVPSLRQLHKRKCFLLGITCPVKEERLWRAEVERQKKLKDERAGERRRVPHGAD